MTLEEYAAHSTPMEYNFKGIPLGPDSGIYALLRQAGQAQRLGLPGTHLVSPCNGAKSK